VRNDPAVDKAVDAAKGDYQNPNAKGGEPTGVARLQPSGVEVTPVASKSGTTANADTGKFSLKGAEAGVHGHLGGTIVDVPVANLGYGDSESLKYGKPQYTVEGNRVGVHIAPGGRLEFRMISGRMTPTEQREMQRNLNSEQLLFMTPKP
jgi:hypothetical protein